MRALLFFATFLGWQLNSPAGTGTTERDVPQSVDQIPFVLGSLQYPQGKGNNRGVLEGQRVPGLTHVQAFLDWRFLETARDVWAWQPFTEGIAAAARHHLKMAIQVGVMDAPAWFQHTPDYQPLVEMTSGRAIDFLSPWAPGTRVAVRHLFEALAAQYPHGEIDSIDFDYPGSDFGEIGLSISGSPVYLPGGSDYERHPQDPAAWKPGGWWCGDVYARADFRRRMLAQYGNLAALNAAWRTNFDSADHIAYPDPKNHAGQDRRWVDFMTWLIESQSRNLADMVAIIRQAFPDASINIPMGFGGDRAYDACDRTGVCQAVAAYKPIVIRSTHAGFNRDKWPLAYWFYKRMAPTAHSLGESFGIEPPGGDLTTAEMRRVMFEDASAGVTFVYHYYQNFHRTPDVVGDYKRILRPWESSLVDLGVLYPSTQMMLDEQKSFPRGQVEFCDMGRDYFDYDIVDENMIGWGKLKNYKVLIHTGGAVFLDSSLTGLTTWLNDGGVLILKGDPTWRDVDGKNDIVSAWLKNEGAPVAPGVRVFQVGRGAVYCIPATDPVGYLQAVVPLLAQVNKATPLHGFDGVADHHYTTEFPDGRLVFDTDSLESSFTPNTSSTH